MTQPKSAPSRLQSFTSEPITVLDDNGRWGISSLPVPNENILLQMYEDMVTARLIDERLEKLLRTGKTSIIASIQGHEAAQIGIAHAMHRGHDWLFPYYRDIGLAVALSSAEEVLAQFLGTCADHSKGRQMPSQPSSDKARIFTASSSIAAQVPPAVGAAMAIKLQGNDEVVVTTSGEGATSEGDWAAAVNLAAVQNAPIIFVCENNGYAISVGYEKQTRSKHICDKARAYNIPGYLVDGMDIMAVYHVMQQAIEDARAGHGPALVELCVYRYGSHTSADDDSVYRSREEVELWKKRDPLPRFRSYLENNELWDTERDKLLYEQTAQNLAKAAEHAEAAGIPPNDWMFDDVYADMPWHLYEQRELVRAEQAPEV